MNKKSYSTIHRSDKREKIDQVVQFNKIVVQLLQMKFGIL